MKRNFYSLFFTLFLLSHANSQTFTFADVDQLIQDSISVFDSNLVVIVFKNDSLIYYNQQGVFDTLTKKGIASATKWISGSVILSLAEEGLFSLDDTIGKFLPLATQYGKGNITIRNCWSMSSGLYGGIKYETDWTLTLKESVDSILINTPQVFLPGTMIAYDGKGMQITGMIAEKAVNGSLPPSDPDYKNFKQIALEKIFSKCDMDSTEYKGFLYNTAIAGGIQSTTADYIKFLKMVLHDGIYNGDTVLHKNSIDEMFTNQTNSAPIYYSYWPVSSPYYPYNEDTLRYGFGCWVLAQNPATSTVEELVCPGYYGMFPWADRCRNIRGICFMDGGLQGPLAYPTETKIVYLIRNIIGEDCLPTDIESADNTDKLIIYPNPSCKTATIKFLLPKTDFVTIKIYDLTGNEVSVLMNKKAVSGGHAVNFDSGNFPTGIYFCKLQTSQSIITKIIEIIK